MTIRVDEDTHARLKELSKTLDMSMSKLIDSLIDQEDKRQFFEKLNKAYKDMPVTSGSLDVYEED